LAWLSGVHHWLSFHSFVLRDLQKIHENNERILLMSVIVALCEEDIVALCEEHKVPEKKVDL
jgi:hypothetical protein